MRNWCCSWLPRWLHDVVNTTHLLLYAIDHVVHVAVVQVLPPCLLLGDGVSNNQDGDQPWGAGGRSTQPILCKVNGLFRIIFQPPLLKDVGSMHAKHSLQNVQIELRKIEVVMKGPILADFGSCFICCSEVFDQPCFWLCCHWGWKHNYSVFSNTMADQGWRGDTTSRRIRTWFSSSLVRGLGM